MMLEIQPLEACLAPAIVQLAQQVRGGELSGSEAEVFANLDRAERRNHSHSVGLVDASGYLRGYLVAWLQESLVRGSSETVVLVDDCCLEPGFQRYFGRLLEALVGTLPVHRGLAIETVVSPEGLDLLADYDSDVVDSGYVLAASHQYFDGQLDMTMTWLRYEKDS